HAGAGPPGARGGGGAGRPGRRGPAGADRPVTPWDAAEVARWLPHRPPRLFVDRVDLLQADPPGLVAGLAVGAGPWEEGGVLPPSLVLEAMAQAARLLANVVAGTPGAIGYLGAVTAELAPAPAGWLELRVHLRPMGEVTRAECEAWTHGARL